MKITKALFYFFFILFWTGVSFSQNFKFISLSDSRGSFNGVNEPVLTKIVKNISDNQVDSKFILYLGDCVTGSKRDPDKTNEQLSHWKKIMSPLYNSPNLVNEKIYVLPGNHEIQHRDDEGNFRAQFPYLPQNGPEDEKGLTYSFDYQSAHFIAVTTNRWFYGDPNNTTDDRRDWCYVKHLDWLEKDIQDAKLRGAKWIFVMSHEPAFPVGGHLRDGLSNLSSYLKLPHDSSSFWYLKKRDEFWNLLKRNNVTAYLCAHEHLYSREKVNGIYQIITGSAGAELYEFNPVFSENNDEKTKYQEMTYNEALPFYKILKYNYGSGKNSQASENFFGLRIFHYAVYEVTDKNVSVKIFGCFPKQDESEVIGGEIKMLDEFIIE